MCHQVKERVLFAIDAAKVVRILRMAKNRPSITCKNLLTKPPYWLKKSETPICKGQAATLHLQTTHLAIVNGSFSCCKRVVYASPPFPFLSPSCTSLFLSLTPLTPSTHRWHKPSATHTYARKRKKLLLPFYGNNSQGYFVAIKEKKEKN